MKTRILLTIGMIAAGAALMASSVSTPKILSVAPNAIARSSNPLTITVQGEDFQPGLTLEITTPGGAKTPIGGNAIESRTLTSFRASVAFNDQGRYELVVMNSDGGVSPPFAIDVKGRAPDGPTIDRINPAETTKKPDQQAFVVEGRNFASGLTVIVTDPTGADVSEVAARKIAATSFELTCTLTMSGDYSVAVTNPGGGTSNVAKISVR